MLQNPAAGPVVTRFISLIPMALENQVETNPEQPAVTTVAAVPTLRNNFVWTFAGNVLYGACQWAILSVIAKLGNTSIVGEYTLGLAVSAPVFMFSNLQLRSVQATDVRAES